MTKVVRERLNKQLEEVRHLIEEIDAISDRLQRAADAAVETITTRNDMKEASDGCPHHPR